jgi:hypothetical protein
MASAITSTCSAIPGQDAAGTSSSSRKSALKRVKVTWADKTAYAGQRVKGQTYYVPRHALVGVDGQPA